MRISEVYYSIDLEKVLQKPVQVALNLSRIDP
jgi:hypothetical protein